MDENLDIRSPRPVKYSSFSCKVPAETLLQNSTPLSPQSFHKSTLKPRCMTHLPQALLCDLHRVPKFQVKGKSRRMVLQLRERLALHGVGIMGLKHFMQRFPDDPRKIRHLDVASDGHATQEFTLRNMEGLKLVTARTIIQRRHQFNRYKE
jgi:hypothetical protein